MKTSDLTGHALDGAVAKCWYGDDYDLSIPLFDDGLIFAPSTNWAHGGPIIERERITVEFLRWDNVDGALPVWLATRIERHSVCEAEGFSPLIAAMRCFVASKLGADVNIPEELA